MPKKTSIATAKISIPGTQSDELCYLFSQQLDERDPHSDTVFGIFQIRASSEAYHSIIEHIVKHLLDFYYRAQENKATMHNEQAVGASEFLFENALQYVNDQVVNMIDELHNFPQGHVAIDRTRISLLIGVISGDELFLTSAGNLVKAYMLYPVSRNGVFSHYSAVTISDDENQERYIDAKKLFTNVIAGTFAIPGSTLVVANARFNDYIPVDQIKQIVTSYPFDHITKYLYNLLGKANENADFNALFLSLQKSEATDTWGGRHQTRSDDSINGLVEQQRNTQHILSPVIAMHIKKQVSHFVDQYIIKTAKVLLQRVKEVDYRKHAKTARTWGKHVSIHARKSVGHLKKNYKNPLPVIKHAASAVSSSQFKTSAIVFLKKWSKKISHNCIEFYSSLKKNGPRYIISWFKGLTMLSKSLLVLAIIFIFLFTTSIITLQRKRVNESTQHAYSQQVVSIEEKINQAESSMIFSDEEHAIQLLAQAQDDLTGLSRTSPDKIKTADELQTRITRATQKINKIYSVESTMVANFDGQIPTLDNISMLSTENKTIVYNTESIYLLSSNDGSVRKINTQAKIPSIGCGAFLSDDLVYFCGKEGDRLYELNLKNNETKQVAISLAKNESLRHITFYSDRLYVLDDTSEIIYRHSKTNNGFGDPTIWYRGANATSLADARQILIDGVAYVYEVPATLLHISGGKVVPLALTGIEPPLTSIDKFWISERSTSLYVLDKTNQRIVIFDKKTLKIIGQLTSDIFSEAESFSVLETKMKIFVLTSHGVYSIPLDYLK
ncbi:MAG: hypothetical protein Q8P11_01080 [bacterium]|nr:hypothetical protein [bacterium]